MVLYMHLYNHVDISGYSDEDLEIDEEEVSLVTLPIVLDLYERCNKKYNSTLSENSVKNTVK